MKKNHIIAIAGMATLFVIALVGVICWQIHSMPSKSSRFTRHKTSTTGKTPSSGGTITTSSSSSLNSKCDDDSKRIHFAITGPSDCSQSLICKYSQQQCQEFPKTDLHRDAWTNFVNPYCAVYNSIIPAKYPRKSHSAEDIEVDALLLKDRFEGAILGMMIGDALGAPYEFETRAQVKAMPHYNDRYHIPHFAKHDAIPGDFTDDSTQGLLWAVSLVLCRGLDAADYFDRLLRWKYQSYFDSTPKAFAFGGATERAFESHQLTLSIGRGDYKKQPQQGNGGIMRLTPVALFFSVLDDERTCAEGVAASTLATHGHSSGRDASRFLGQLYWKFLRYPNNDHIHKCVTQTLMDIQDLWPHETGHDPLIQTLYKNGQANAKDDKDYSGSARGALNYVMKALQELQPGDSFDKVLWKVIDYGWDTDTTGAILGGLLGLLYGRSQIPKWMIDQVYGGPAALQLADLLLQVSLDPNVSTLMNCDILIKDGKDIMDFNPGCLSENLWYFNPHPDILKAKQQIFKQGLQSPFKNRSARNAI